jgi:hypothetical protein
MTLYTYTVTIDNVERNVLSFADPDDVLNKGLIGKSVIGYLKETDKEVLPENIVYNADFVEIFKRTIKTAALASVDLMKSASQQQNGFVYIIDQRTKDQNETKARDILGSFEVIGGQLNTDSFQFNPNYQIISTDGLFRLPDNFEKAILNEIAE